MINTIKNILKSIPSKTIIGLRTINDAYNNLSYGEIVDLKNTIVEFKPYFDDGTPCVEESILYHDIVSIELNSKETNYLKKVIITKPTSKETRRIYLKKEITLSLLKSILGKEMAIFHINKDYFTGYLLAVNNNYTVFQTLDPIYNIDYGISYYPLNSLKGIIVHDYNLDIYQYIYQNSITPFRTPDLFNINKGDFFKKHEHDGKVIDIEDVNDIKEGVTKLGYVDNTTCDAVSINIIDEKGRKISNEKVKIKNIINYGEGGFYLNKIELLYKNNLYNKSNEEIYSQKDGIIFYELINECQKTKKVVSLISDKDEFSYFESTGYIVNLIDNWIKMKVYDIEEDDWYDYYRKIEDFSDIRINSYIELLVDLIGNSKKREFVY